MEFESLHDRLREIGKTIPNTRFKGAMKDAYALALLDLAHEHAKSITLLAEKDLIASGWALLRSCIEAYVRGCWLAHFATKSQIEKIRIGKDGWDSFVVMLQKLDQMDDVPEGYHTARYKKSFSLLSGLTHGGWPQLVKRINSGTLKYVPEEGEVEEAVMEAVFISCMANIRMAEIIGTTDAVQKISGMMNELFSSRN